MSDKVEMFNYGNYSSSNYGSCRGVTIGKLTLYFSYETVIGFEDEKGEFISENVWSTTTGRHLNWLENDKKARIQHSVFINKLDDCLKRHKLTI